MLAHFLLERKMEWSNFQHGRIDFVKFDNERVRGVEINIRLKFNKVEVKSTPGSDDILTKLTQITFKNSVYKGGITLALFSLYPQMFPNFNLCFLILPSTFTAMFLCTYRV